MFRVLLLSGVAVAFSGCFTMGYLAQAGAGQLDLIRRGQPIAHVVNDRSQPRRTRALLAQVKRIKAWGLTRGLKPTQSYQRYSDLGRSAAVYVVQGCAPLSFDVRRWEFPIVGTVPYLGFFNEAEARRYADQLARDEHLDVAVRGAAAYSTLGWFNDPVLSTMLGEGPDALGDLAETILHESVHATVYVPGQSSFDESLASFVSEGLTSQWLAEQFGPESGPVRSYAAAQERALRFGAELHQTYEALDALYRSRVTDEAKRIEKQRILSELQGRLGLKRVLNNASLAGFRTYASSNAGLVRLKAACGTWERLLAATATLKPSDFGRSQQDDFDAVVDALAQRRCAVR